MRFSSRFFLYAPFVLVLLAAAVAGLLWKHQADRLSAMLDAANGHQIVPGVQMSFASKSIGGFPFRLETRLENLKLETSNANGPLIWKSEHFAAHALTYGRDETIFEAAGKQSLEWTNDEGEKRGLVFAVGTLRASAILDKGALARFDLDVQDFGSPAFVAARLQFHIRRNPSTDALDVVFQAIGVQLSKGVASPLGDDIHSAEFDAQLAPATPLEPVLSGGGNWRQSLAAWRAHMGRLRIQSLSVDWGKPSISGHGELALDAQNRPLGVLTLDVSGYQALLGSLGPKQRGIGDALIGFAARRGSANGTVEARLAFKDGIAYVGDTPAGFVTPLY